MQSIAQYVDSFYDLDNGCIKHTTLTELGKKSLSDTNGEQRWADYYFHKKNRIGHFLLFLGPHRDI